MSTIAELVKVTRGKRVVFFVDEFAATSGEATGLDENALAFFRRSLMNTGACGGRIHGFRGGEHAEAGRFDQRVCQGPGLDTMSKTVYPVAKVRRRQELTGIRQKNTRRRRQKTAYPLTEVSPEIRGCICDRAFARILCELAETGKEQWLSAAVCRTSSGKRGSFFVDEDGQSA
jgi:hypothetical protein